VAGKGILIRVASQRIFIVALAGSLGLLFAYNSATSNQTNQYELRALAIAEATASMPTIPDLLESGDPQGRLAVLGETVRQNTQASYVVIANSQGIRFSHPNPKLIGKKLDGPQPALQGRSYTTIDKAGTLGISVNGKAPIYDTRGRIVGMVSAGILLSALSTGGSYLVHGFLIYGIGLLLLGLLISELLVRLVRGRKLNEELEAITTLTQEREAMLHSIKEGVITLNLENKVTLINDEAIRLLELNEVVIGKRVDDVATRGRLSSLLLGDVEPDDDLQVLTEKYSIVVNRRQVLDGHKLIGFVITLRDRTEHIELLRELESVKNLTDALRSQQHEFANRLHTVNGLLELTKYDEAEKYLGEIAFVQSNLAEELSFKLGNSLITALLIAKVTIAKERGVTLTITAETSLDDLKINPNALVTIVGNLIDNAIDAASGSPMASVEVLFSKTNDHSKFILVHDSGPGLPEIDPSIVFQDGYTTKVSRGDGHRGLGLAIVHRLVKQSSGVITASNNGGAAFLVNLPIDSQARSKARI